MKSLKFVTLLFIIVILTGCANTINNTNEIPNENINNNINQNSNVNAGNQNINEIPAPVDYTNPVVGGEQGSQSTVTLEDNNKTINLKVGDRFLLNLGEFYDWNINVDDQTITSRVINITVIRGAQGMYVAKNIGQTELSGVGDPQCRKSVPACGAPSILFKLKIVVEK